MRAPTDPRPDDGLTLLALGCERGGQLLFDGLTLALRPGQMLRVRGANGAGKSSLLRVLCGLQPAARGSVHWRGQPISTQREAFVQSLAYVGHAAAMSDELTPLENLRASCEAAADPVPADHALQALREAGLAGLEHRPCKRLSQGQRRRCALARLGLSARRALWVLDEPFTALDADASRWLESLLRDHLRRDGLLVLTSHHEVALDARPHLALTL